MITLSKSTDFSSEYCARIVRIDSFESHPNPKCTKMKCALVGAYSISVSLDTEPGYFIYFPVGSQINGSYLSAMGLFREPRMNKDQAKVGFFYPNGKVKPIRLQGYPSEGFLMPYDSLKDWLDDELPEPIDYYEFDSCNGEILVKRYIVPVSLSTMSNKVRGKDPSKKLTKLIEGQFHFHYDTDSLEKAPWVIKPWNLIEVSTKFHGTSGISAYVLCKKRLSPDVSTLKYKDKNGKKLIAKAKLHKLQKRAATAPPKIVIDYDFLYASRKVVKNESYNSNLNKGYYGNDAFRYHANEILKPHLAKGMTLYYELVGFCTNGTPIQHINKIPMDYGCVPPGEGETYTYGKHYDIRIYRITLTTPDGFVHEFSMHEVQLWCKAHNLHAVKELYWGFAKDLYPDLDPLDPNWSIKFCQKLKEDTEHFYMELDSPDCSNPVPHEGIVIRIDDGKSAAYKVKSFRFIHKEDADYEAGEINIEDQELES